MVKLFLEAATIALTAFISPLAGDRRRVREIIGPENMLGGHCDCPLAVCEERDVKGKYKKGPSRADQKIHRHLGPLLPLSNQVLRLDTGQGSLEICVEAVCYLLLAIKLVKTA